MSRNGYAVMNARNAHIGGSKEENGKRQNKRTDAQTFVSGKRGMSLEELRKGVLESIPKKHKRLKADVDMAFRGRKKIPAGVYQFLEGLEADPKWRAGIAYLRSLGEEKVRKTRQLALA